MRDLTKGSIIKTLISLAAPIMLTNLLHSAYHLVDTFWVGHLGAEAVAAVSLSFPMIFLMITLGGGFSIAGTILVSQYKGKGDQKQVDHVVGQTVVMMFIISIFVSILGYFTAEPVMKLLGAAPNVLPDGVAFLQTSFIGMVFVFSFFVFQSLMRGIGEVRTPMYIVGSTVLMNLVLGPVFIMGWGPIPGYGVQGAAMVTIFCQGVATAIGFYILLKGKRGIKLTLKGFKFDKPLLKKMFFLGLPSSIEQSMKAIGMSIMTFLVATLGTPIVAAYGIGVRIFSLVIIPAFGLSMATATLVGQNIGAGKPDRAEDIGKKSLLFAFFLLFTAGVFFFIFARQMVIAFIPDEPQVIEYATTFLKYLSLGFAFIGLQLILNGIFTGSGNTKQSMIFSLISLWIFEFPIAYILSKVLGFNELGIWIGAPVAAVLASIVPFIYFKSGKWKKTRIIEPRQTKLEDAVREEVLIEEGR